MLGRIFRVFLRYRDLHVDLSREGRVFENADGQFFGRISKLSLSANRLGINASVKGDSLSLKVKDGSVEVAISPPQNGAEFSDISIDLPYSPSDLKMTLRGKGQSLNLSQPTFSTVRIKWHYFILAGRFCGTLFLLLPTIFQWKWHGDLSAREVVKKRLGFSRPRVGIPLSDSILRPVEGRSLQPPFEGVRIIMPVYNAFDVLCEALDRVAVNTEIPWELIVVEDASTDPRVRPWLEAWADRSDLRSHVRLLTNEENLGFVGSVNRCFSELDFRDSRPIVLLNSDALVPKDWASRLLAPLSDPKIASVTPMSNDGEILSVPVICKSASLPDGVANALDEIAAALPGGHLGIPIPTGVGFCMALSPKFMAQVPEFDTVFDRGYGEEVDWCQKVRALGGVHVGLPNLFVEHRGGTSFGSVEKRKLIEKNAVKLEKRYPSYASEVQRFWLDDPLATARLALALALLDITTTVSQVPVYLAHSLGGGADMWLEEQLALDIKSGGGVVLRVGQDFRWQIEAHTPWGITAGLTDDTQMVQDLLSRLPRRRIVYSCGVGDRHAISLPDILCDLVPFNGDMEVLFHDYFPISPSYVLLDHDGIFRGVPTLETSRDLAHHPVSADVGDVDLKEWQRAWGRLIDRSNRIVVFSQNSRDIVTQAFPEAIDKIIVQPHQINAQVMPIQRPKVGASGPTIGVLGNIGFHKGADVVCELAKKLKSSGFGRVVILGNLDPMYSLGSAGHVHGSYNIQDLAMLVARYNIQGWFIPSIWPETFSFTTHEALATKLPVVTFDLGAQGEAARAATNGYVLPISTISEMDPKNILDVIGVRDA